jgi:5-methylcytosine-specific restriction endonuclease McrA
MRKVCSKSPRLRLDANSYRELHRQVLQRDGWRCQVCGSMQRLQVHHLKLRSQSGSDMEQNLITLCSECHSSVHASRRRSLR